jgi:hypothetical protein
LGAVIVVDDLRREWDWSAMEMWLGEVGGGEWMFVIVCGGAGCARDRRIEV